MCAIQMTRKYEKKAIGLAFRIAVCAVGAANMHSISFAQTSDAVSSSSHHPENDRRMLMSTTANEVRAEMVPKIGELMAEQAIPSMTIILFDRKEILWAESFGYANLATRTYADLETVYNTGSTFKFVIVSAIMQLVERGELSLDEPVNQYLSHKIDDLSEEGFPLTLRAMLAHRAGLPASRPVPDTDIWSRTLPLSDTDLLDDLKVIAPPGQSYDYCNICFPVYGEIIREVTGQSVEDYIRDNILGLAGVKYTEPFYPSARAAEQIAVPYSRVGKTAWPVGQKFLEGPYSGDAYMRPIDMARLLQPFLDEGRLGEGRLLKPKTVQSMILPQYEGGQISLGFLSSVENGTRVLSWDGGIYGGSTVYQLEPETGIGIYIASNADQITGILHQLAKRTRHLSDQRPIEQLDIAPLDGAGPVVISDDRLNALVGRYSIPGSEAELTVHRLGDQLALVNPAGSRLELVMIGEAKGILVSSREEITFGRQSDGSATSLVLSGDGYSFEAIRQPSSSR